MKPRILFLLHLPPPVHGAAMVGRYINKSLVINQSYDCQYVNLSTSTTLQGIGKGGIKKLYIFWKLLVEVFNVLLTNNHDLVYVTLTARPPGFYKDFFIVLILKAFRKNIVYHFHNKGVDQSGKNWINKLLYGFAFKNTKTILLSPRLYDDVARFVPAEDVFYCANGIPDLHLSITPDVNGEDKRSTPFRLLFLSNMMVQKGVLVLLEACKLLSHKNIDFECHFVGAWSDISKTDFNLLISGYKLENNVFAHGEKHNHEKFEFYRNSDVFIFPSFYFNECFPLVLLEAMQFKLPVISTTEGGIADIVIDGETGYLVPKKNAEYLAEKIETLIREPGLAKEMGMKGRKRFEQLFTLAEFENNLNKILRQILAGKQKT